MRNAAARPEGEINLTHHLTSIIAEIIRHSPSLAHIDVGKVLVCIGSNRSGRRGGLYGKLIPLRFENGTEIVRYRGRYYTLPAISHNGADCLYIIYFYMPRFFDLPWDEKLRVIFHELYHISPRFDGDIRRMGAVKKAHGHSRKHFDTLYANELKAFTEHVRETAARSFLEMNTAVLYGSYRKVTGVRMKSPRPVLLEHK